MTATLKYDNSPEAVAAAALEAQEIGEVFAAKIKSKRKLLEWERFRAQVRKENGLPPIPMTKKALRVLKESRVQGGAS